jgi:hypothetical protein
MRLSEILASSMDVSCLTSLRNDKVNSHSTAINIFYRFHLCIAPDPGHLATADQLADKGLSDLHLESWLFVGFTLILVLE